MRSLCTERGCESAANVGSMLNSLLDPPLPPPPVLQGKGRDTRYHAVEWIEGMQFSYPQVALVAMAQVTR